MLKSRGIQQIIGMTRTDGGNCDGGNYPQYTIHYSDGSEYTGRTCGCGRGCSNTDDISALLAGVNSGKIWLNMEA